MKSGIQGFNGDRLRQAREALGLRLSSLADMASVSRQCISQYELGESLPGPEVFDRLAICLRQESQFFLRSSTHFDPSPRFFRSMASATKTARLRAEARLTWFREVTRYMSDVVEFPMVNFPDFGDILRNPGLVPIEEIEDAAAETRKHWKLGNGPIANLVDVAESHGAIVLRHSLDSAALDAVSQWTKPEGVPLIVLNADKSVAVRSRLDLAHELGHMALHRHLPESALQNDESFDQIETQAFRFGAALLLPERPFLEDLYSASLDGLRSLKVKWKVSIAMMIERLKSLGIIDANEHRRLRINYNARKWTKQEPFDKEIPMEQPQVINRAIRLLTVENLASLDHMAAQTGITRQWIEQILDVPPTKNGGNVRLKLVEFNRRA